MINNLSEVPPTWIKVRFDEIAENITDRIDKPKESGLEYYIGLEHLDTDQIRIKRFGSTDDVEATKFLCKKGDIIFGKRNAYLRKVAVTDRDAVVSAHSMVIRPKGNLIVPDFLPCFMQSSVFWKTAHAISEGSMSPTIKWKTLAKQEFWVPSIEEQRKIAKVLWTVETNAEKNQKIIDRIVKFKDQFIDELLTKGIGHKKFKKTELGEIPEEWKIGGIIDLVDKSNKNSIKPGPFGSSLKKSDYVNSGYRVYGQEQVIAGSLSVGNYYIDSNKFKELKNFEVKEGDVLISLVGTIGRVLVVPAKFEPGIINPRLLKITLDKKIADSDFISNLITSEYVLNQISQIQHGGTMNILSGKTMKLLKFAIPSIEEQKEIVNICEILEIGGLKHNNHLTCLYDLKKKLTDDFLSGKLLIPEGILENVQ